MPSTFHNWTFGSWESLPPLPEVDDAVPDDAILQAVDGLLAHASASSDAAMREKLDDRAFRLVARHARHTQSDRKVETHIIPLHNPEESRSYYNHYTAERARLLQRISATQGVEAVHDAVRYEYSGRRLHHRVQLTGSPSAINRVSTLFRALDERILAGARDMPFRGGTAPGTKTRVRREFVEQYGAHVVNVLRVAMR